MLWHYGDSPLQGHMLGGKKIAPQGGGGDTETHFPSPPPSILGRRDGRGEFWAGVPDLPCRGEGVNPTSMAQNDTHVALIILTTQMWGGGGLLVERTCSGQILCLCAFGANIRSYTKQKAQHETPILQPPPLLRRASMSAPPPRAEQFSGCPAMWSLNRLHRCPATSGVDSHPDCPVASNRPYFLLTGSNKCSGGHSRARCIAWLMHHDCERLGWHSCLEGSTTVTTMVLPQLRWAIKRKTLVVKVPARILLTLGSWSTRRRCG